jgi:Fur family transcriptional regulator, ferric uptake regulator
MKIDSQDELSIFRDFIRKKRLRITSEREIILREIMTHREHFDADLIHLRLRQQKVKISKSSIYRTIPLLLECGLIQESFYRNGRLLYEHIFGQGHHCHMRCLECEYVVEYCLDELRMVEEKLGRMHDFDVRGHRLEVYGYCPTCRHRMREPEAPLGGQEGAND